MITKTSGSKINAFSADPELMKIIDSTKNKLGVTRSALIRYGLLLAARKLNARDAGKAKRIIIKES